jgi:hypothetical protein
VVVPAVILKAVVFCDWFREWIPATTTHVVGNVLDHH